MGESSSMQWYRERKAAQAQEDKNRSSPTLAATGTNTNVMSRIHGTGHAPGFQVSDHRNELSHDKSWIYAATHANAIQVAQAEFTAYDRSMEQQVGGDAMVQMGARRFIRKSMGSDNPAEQRTPIQNHPALRLLKRPNPLMSQFGLLYQISKQLDLTGSFVIWEVLNQLGMPFEWWVLPRGWLTYHPPSPEYPMGLWKVNPPRTTAWFMGNTQMAAGFYLDVRSTIFDGWRHSLYPGEFQSPLEACAQIIDITEKADEATWAAWVNTPRPGMIFRASDGLLLTKEQIDDAKAEIRANLAGQNNVGKPMFLHGVDPVPYGGMLGDLNNAESRAQNKEFIQSIFQVPNIAFGGLDGATYGGNKATLDGWIEIGIRPRLRCITDAFTFRLQRYYGEDFELEASAHRSDDPTLDQTRADRLLAGVQQGVCTGNEWRACLKLPPRPELDELINPNQPQPGMEVGPDGQPLDPNAMAQEGDGGFDLSPEMDNESSGTDAADSFDIEPTLDSEDSDTPQPANRMKEYNGVHLNGVH